LYVYINIHGRLTIHRLCFRNLKIKNINILTVRVRCDVLIFFKKKTYKKGVIQTFAVIAKAFHSCLFDIFMFLFLTFAFFVFSLIQENDATDINEMKVIFFIF